jgi:hypothetical protein
MEMTEPYFQSIAADEGADTRIDKRTAAAPLYDPLTIFYLAHPESCETYS